MQYSKVPRKKTMAIYGVCMCYDVFQSPPLEKTMAVRKGKCNEENLKCVGRKFKLGEN